jgi:hypothetical protein
VRQSGWNPVTLPMLCHPRFLRNPDNCAVWKKSGLSIVFGRYPGGILGSLAAGILMRPGIAFSRNL